MHSLGVPCVSCYDVPHSVQLYFVRLLIALPHTIMVTLVQGMLSLCFMATVDPTGMTEDYFRVTFWSLFFILH